MKDTYVIRPLFYWNWPGIDWTDWIFGSVYAKFELNLFILGAVCWSGLNIFVVPCLGGLGYFLGKGGLMRCTLSIYCIEVNC